MFRTAISTIIIQQSYWLRSMLILMLVINMVVVESIEPQPTTTQTNKKKIGRQLIFRPRFIPYTTVDNFNQQSFVPASLAPIFQPQTLFVPTTTTTTGTAGTTTTLIAATAIPWQTNRPIYTSTAAIPLAYAQLVAAAAEPQSAASIFMKQANNIVQPPYNINTNNNNNNNNVFTKRIDTNMPQHDHKQCQMSMSNSGSENYPVYVLPPKNFQPIIYQQSNPLGSFFAPLVYHTQQQQQQQPQQQRPVQPFRTQQQQAQSQSFLNEKIKTSEELWYEAGNQDDDDQLKLEKPNLNRNQLVKQHKIVLVPVPGTNFDNVPLLEASVVRDEDLATSTEEDDGINYPEMANNPYGTASKTVANKTISFKPIKRVEQQQQATSSSSSSSIETNNHENSDRRQLKTKLPVGMTSFFLGGTRGVSGRHWQMPYYIVNKLEFMPNLSPPLGVNNEYYPVKQDNDPPVVNTDGQPEKEDTVDDGNQNGRDKNKKKPFDLNTIIDTEEDLEAQESSVSLARTTMSGS